MQLQKKEACPSDEKRKTENIIYRCVVSTSSYPDKAHLGTVEGDFLKNI